MIKRIAITGPESTGKSTLASDLAKYYKTVWVPEYAREYLEKINRPYQYEDIVEIAKGQLIHEDSFIQRAKKILISDTELLVTKVWSEYKYGKCDSWIIDELQKPRYDLYLLTDIDIPWEYDPLREHPETRTQLFNIYHKEIKKQGIPFIVISGPRERRLQKAVEYINQTIIR